MTECLKLGVKDIDFKRNEINIRSGKGDNDWKTILPCLLLPELKRQIEKGKLKFEENLIIKDFKRAAIPEALERKYPNAPKEIGWQYILPSEKPASDLWSRRLQQHHRHEGFFAKSDQKTVRKTDRTKNASCHTFCHSFVTHLLEDGYDNGTRTIQELLGYKAIRPTMIYTYVLHRNKFNVQSPLEV